jgi:hypothetical protein
MQEIEFNRISGLHPKAAALVKQLHAVSYTATVKDIEPAGLLALARLYPIHVVEKESPIVTDAKDSPVQEEYTFQVIAGFRLYELMCTARVLSVQDAQLLNLIPVIIHQNIKPKEIVKLAELDLAGSPLLFSLGNKVFEQLRLIKKHVSADTLNVLPKYRNLRYVKDTSLPQQADELDA